MILESCPFTVEGGTTSTLVTVNSDQIKPEWWMRYFTLWIWFTLQGACEVLVMNFAQWDHNMHSHNTCTNGKGAVIEEVQGWNTTGSYVIPTEWKT